MATIRETYSAGQQGSPMAPPPPTVASRQGPSVSLGGDVRERGSKWGSSESTGRADPKGKRSWDGSPRESTLSATHTRWTTEQLQDFI